MSLPAVFSATRRTHIVAVLTAFVLALLALASPSATKPANAATVTWTHTDANRYAYDMLYWLNRERAWNHVPPLTMDHRLRVSALQHDLNMSTHNEMSHQVPGEAFFGTRMSKAGYNWQAAGENIGYTGSVSLTALSELEHEMYIEKAPNNGHRLNILSRSYRQIGIYVHYDATHHKLWFTQDFGELM